MKTDRPNIIDVARRAGVSTATVSHVINGSRKVSPATRERVEAAIATLDYRINVLARNLRVGQSRVIAFVVASLATDFFLAMARGIEQVLSEHDWQLVLVNSNEQVQTERRQVRFLRDQSIAGLIIVPTTDDHQYIEELLPPEVPLIFVDRQPSAVRGDSVVSTNREGTYEGVSHLIMYLKREARYACIYVCEHGNLCCDDGNESIRSPRPQRAPYYIRAALRRLLYPVR